MDYLQRFVRQAQLQLWAVLMFSSCLIATAWWLGSTVFKLRPGLLAIVFTAVTILVTGLIAWAAARYFLKPLQVVWQTVLHLAPSTNGEAPPKADSLRFGKELVTVLSNHIYELTAVPKVAESQPLQADLQHNFLAQNLPIPLFILDPQENITFANLAAGEYLGLKPADMVGKNAYMVLDMSFPSEDTFDNWLKGAKTAKATAVKSWERVKLNVRDSHPVRLFDLAAYYNRDNPEKIETMLVLFDHTRQYSQEDQAVSFTALSVHELRTPLSLLRGYIEVLDEELDGKLSPELQAFMLKMQAQAEQLTAFVNNILNVARVDDDQLELKLEQEDWGATLKSTVEMIGLQAKVRGITIQCSIARNLPAAAIDKLSIREVVNNLIDNAIKYSGSSKVIKVDTYLNKAGQIETTIQDFGVGIPTSVIPNLFTKFYRDHHNRASIGGTGLGLYLSKAIITAHGGNLWVRSPGEGKGSVFGFTVLPYDQLPENLKPTGGQDVTRTAHGWIKNHSLYRR